MSADDWQKVKDILEQAAALAPADRPRFLDDVCGGDAFLRREVESLLANHHEKSGLLMQPAIAGVAEMFVERVNTRKEGQTWGHYRIISRIGAGGMGEVYRARDERLDREVAVKILPPSTAEDADRLARFTREARATSALNHPNILTVYDVGEHEGTPYIVSELLDGEELRDRLSKGPIPLKRTIDYARQIVDGLSAAHEKGIVHRDLKPENLFVTKDERVKILDFGLAKLRDGSSSIHASEDVTREALTHPGMIMGTVALRRWIGRTIFARTRSKEAAPTKAASSRLDRPREICRCPQ